MVIVFFFYRQFWERQSETIGMIIEETVRLALVIVAVAPEEEIAPTVEVESLAHEQDIAHVVRAAQLPRRT